MTVYGLLGTVQAMSYIYLISTLTTLERRFGIPSKTTGIMLSGNEISQILLSLVLTYYGGQRNRPVWIAWGVAFSALSCFVLAALHFIYGPGPTALSLTKEYLLENNINQTSLELKERMGLCTRDDNPRDCQASDFSLVPPTVVFLSQFILGIGTTLYYSLGQTYMDDNTKKKNTPLLLGLTMALRTMGPTVGFVISYICLSMYIDPSLTPMINKKDPRWLGAWWIGWILLGFLMFAFTFLMAMFPKELKKPVKEIKLLNKEERRLKEDMNSNGVKSDPPPIEEKPKAPTMKEFPAALKRICTNKLLVINIFSGIFYILGGTPFITYITKYLEVQFDKSAAGANIIIGPVVVFSMVLGFLGSGIIISKFKPRPPVLLGWNVLVGVIYVFGEISFIFLSCNSQDFVGYHLSNRSINVINECNQDCSCDNLKYAPVCMEESGLTFYTACHAGCQSMSKVDGVTTYSNCTCIPSIKPDIHGIEDPSKYEYQTFLGSIKVGPCKTECGYNFIIFITLTCILQSMGCSGKIGNILVNYRAVRQEDKSFAQGLSLLLISIFAFIPGPIIFGAIIDSTCLLWDENCGKRGNCWFYDKDNFRFYLNSTSACLTLIGVLLDVVVCYLGRNLVLYEDEPELPTIAPPPNSKRADPK